MPSTGILMGRVALVTGAASGIGRSVCEVFAREGASVVAVDVQEEANQMTIKSLTQGNHFALTSDVSKSSSVNEIFAKIKERFNGPPSIVVNSAGIVRDELLLKQTEENFDKVIEVNLKGTFLITQTAAKMMLSEKVKDASIVNISSIVGKAGNVGQSSYAASKAGIMGLTKSASKELSRFNIRVNAVLPGYIVTPMTDAVPEEYRQMMLKLIPLQRLGQPKEVAEVCLFLAGKHSSYITGACIDVNGGLSI